MVTSTAATSSGVSHLVGVVVPSVAATVVGADMRARLRGRQLPPWHARRAGRRLGLGSSGWPLFLRHRHRHLRLRVAPLRPWLGWRFVLLAVVGRRQGCASFAQGRRADGAGRHRGCRDWGSRHGVWRGWGECVRLDCPCWCHVLRVGPCARCTGAFTHVLPLGIRRVGWTAVGVGGNCCSRRDVFSWPESKDRKTRCVSRLEPGSTEIPVL